MRPFLGTDNPEPKKPHYHFCKVSVHVYFCDNGKYTSYFQNHLKTNYGGKKRKQNMFCCLHKSSWVGVRRSQPLGMCSIKCNRTFLKYQEPRTTEELTKWNTLILLDITIKISKQFERFYPGVRYKHFFPIKEKF